MEESKGNMPIVLSARQKIELEEKLQAETEKKKRRRRKKGEKEEPEEETGFAAAFKRKEKDCGGCDEEKD